ncbi:MAG: protein-L-isoaspartate(D-aspartate) O-methyltransferase [Nitriliruptor sp.]|nr:MAG: protein-L-isoaspartate(D-aspartate) O-methyltransferase [Nitriliruptor sp.]
MRHRAEPPLVRAARRAGVSDERVLDAVGEVPRERFVPPDRRAEASRDRPVRIGQEQTTSQPSLVAMMCAALELRGTERVLEIGTGLGYQAAVLSHLAAEVCTIERHVELAEAARRNLDAVGIDNVTVVAGDGTRGLPDHAPFDAVIIAAAAPGIPPAITEQIVHGGRLVAPVSQRGVEQVLVYTRDPDGLTEQRRLTAARFVPLVAGSD